MIKVIITVGENLNGPDKSYENIHNLSHPLTLAYEASVQVDSWQDGRIYQYDSNSSDFVSVLYYYGQKVHKKNVEFEVIRKKDGDFYNNKWKVIEQNAADCFANDTDTVKAAETKLVDEDSFFRNVD